MQHTLGIFDMVARRSFDESTLTRLRALPIVPALDLVETLRKDDRTLVSAKAQRARRWGVSKVRGRFENLATGIKRYDTRALLGCSGAIDAAMHLLGLPFVDWVKYLVDGVGKHGADPA